MAITRTQTELGKNFPFFDHGDPAYNRLLNSVASDDLHPTTIQYAEVAVSVAEMLALRATPKELVAAPGAGYVLEFVSALFIYDYAAVFTESGQDIVARFTGTSGAIASTTLDTTGLLDQTADQLRTLKPIVTDLTPVANSPLVLHNSGNGEWGGTGSPCRVKVAYRVHATGL
jgi:hypothetical protein